MGMKITSYNACYKKNKSIKIYGGVYDNSHNNSELNIIKKQLAFVALFAE